MSPSIRPTQRPISLLNSYTHTQKVILICAVNNLLQIVKCCLQHNLIDTVMGTAIATTAMQLALQQQEQQ